MRRKKRKPKQISVEPYTKYLYAAVYLVGVLLLFFFLKDNKPLIIIIAFEVLDLIKNFVIRTTRILPIGFSFVFSITAAYYYNILAAVTIFILMVINRVVMLRIEMRHIVKFTRHFPLYILVTYLRPLPFFQAALIVLGLNAIVKIIVRLTINPTELVERGLFSITSFVLAIIAFYFISIIYLYLPWLY